MEECGCFVDVYQTPVEDAVSSREDGSTLRNSRSNEETGLENAKIRNNTQQSDLNVKGLNSH
jgi:hypothetical protein